MANTDTVSGFMVSGFIVSGFMDIPADRLNDAKAALPAHVEATLAEPGNISFELVWDNSLKGRLHVKEAFTDQAAFEAHQARAKGTPWALATLGIPRNFQISS